jgi:hypothetical protein
MRRRLATLAAVSALALALSASPAFAGSPAEHFRSIPAGGMVFACGPTTLTTTSGTMDYVTRTASSASGNWTQTGTLTLNHVLAVDSNGNEYSVTGAAHFGFSYNAQTGIVTGNVDGFDVSQAITTFKFQFVSTGGGIAGSLDLVQHVSPNGNYNEFWAGTCTFA